MAPIEPKPTNQQIMQWRRGNFEGVEPRFTPPSAELGGVALGAIVEQDTAEQSHEAESTPDATPDTHAGQSVFEYGRQNAGLLVATNKPEEDVAELISKPELTTHEATVPRSYAQTELSDRSSHVTQGAELPARVFADPVAALPDRRGRVDETTPRLTVLEGGKTEPESFDWNNVKPGNQGHLIEAANDAAPVNERGYQKAEVFHNDTIPQGNQHGQQRPTA